MPTPTNWSFEDTELGLITRVTLAGIDQAETRDAITPQAAEEFREVASDARNVLIRHASRDEELRLSPELSPEGKETRRAKLVEDTWARLEGLRRTATRAVADRDALRDRADRLEPTESGFFRESPAYQPSAEDLAHFKELRDYLSSMSVEDVRAEYLRRVRDYGHDAVTRAVESDPVATLKPVDRRWLDDRTTAIAKSLRVDRLGLTAAVKQADTYAALLTAFVDRVASALGVVKERPAVIRH